MNRNRVHVVVAPFAVLLAALGVSAVGCGGSSKSSTVDPLALCNQACDKTIPLCTEDAGITSAQIAAATTLCKSQCTSSSVSSAIVPPTAAINEPMPGTSAGSPDAPPAIAARLL